MNIIAKYGMCITSQGSDDVERSMALNELSNGSYGLELRTTYPDQDAPVVTVCALSKEGLNMLSQLLSLVHTIRDYPITNN